MKDVLRLGFTQEETKEQLQNGIELGFSRTTSQRQVSAGLSYCKMDDKVKKLSFVFFATCEKKRSILNRKTKWISTDSRGSFFETFPLNGSYFNAEHSVPAYLVVFEDAEEVCKMN